MAPAGIPDIGDTASGHWGKEAVIGRVVSKHGGIQLALFSDKPGPPQVITDQDAQFISAPPPAWSKDLASAEQADAAQYRQWREGIEARRIDALLRVTYAKAAAAEAERMATIRAARAARGRDIDRDRER